MIIKIDKQKVVAAAELEIERLKLKVNEFYKKRKDDRESMHEEGISRNEKSDRWARFIVTQGFGSPYSPDSFRIDKINNIITACNLSEEQTVTITDEDVELLGL